MLTSSVPPEVLRTIAASPHHRGIKQRGYALLRARRGDRILDLGCGPGIDTIAFGRSVGPLGKVVGIDADPQMVVEANQAAKQAGVDGWVEHRLADAAQLSDAAGTYDACYTERMLQHLTPQAGLDALREMMRVLKPGGRLVAIDADWGSLSVDCDELDVERRIIAVHAAKYPNGCSGRRLYRQLNSLGLENVVAEPFGKPLSYAAVEALLADSEQRVLAQGMITPEEFSRWRSDLSQASRDGVFFAHFNIVVAAGQKPCD